jgi:hypothetical protein
MERTPSSLNERGGAAAISRCPGPIRSDQGVSSSSRPQRGWTSSGAILADLVAWMWGGSPPHPGRGHTHVTHPERHAVEIGFRPWGRPSSRDDRAGLKLRWKPRTHHDAYGVRTVPSKSPLLLPLSASAAESHGAPPFAPTTPSLRACVGLWSLPGRAAPCARIRRKISGVYRSALVGTGAMPVPARCRGHIDGNPPSVLSSVGAVPPRDATSVVLVICSSGAKAPGRYSNH